MAASKLGRILELFQEMRTPLSLGYVAHQLDLSPQMAESMLQYWILKGRIHPVSEAADCGRCAVNGSCPFIFQLPTAYELTAAEGDLPPAVHPVGPQEG